MLIIWFKQTCYLVAKSCPTLCYPMNTPGACQAPLSFTISQSLLKFMSTELVMLSKHIILCPPFSFCLQSFSVSRSFSMSQLFSLGGQRTGASASVLPMNIQGRFPLGLTDLISFQSKELSRVFFITVQKHLFLDAQRSLWPNSHIHT